jgi:hypothetical protein
LSIGKHGIAEISAALSGSTEVHPSISAVQKLGRSISHAYSKSTMVVKSCQKVYISHMSKPAMDKRNRYADT